MRISKISPSTVGTISELKVAADLLKHGFAVFKAVSPNCYCDLYVTKRRKRYRVEVKTGYRTKKGIKHGNYPSFLYDILATVVDNDILYEPDILTIDTINKVNKLDVKTVKHDLRRARKAISSLPSCFSG